MKVFALIPVHNRLAETRRIVDCLRAQALAPIGATIEIVVIDDGSTDDTPAFLAAAPDVTTIVGDGSLWWGGAIDRGLEHVLANSSDDDYVLLINNDTFVEPEFVPTLLSVSRQNGAAIVGAILRNIERRDEVLEIGPVVDVWTMRVWDRLSTLSEAERRALQAEYPVDALPGRGCVYPVRAFRVGGRMFPKLLPHYYADYELAMRMRRHGFPLLVTTRTAIYTKNEFSVQREDHSWFQTFFGERSHRNIFRRIAFFSLAGTPWERLTAVPRMMLFAGERPVHRVLHRLRIRSRAKRGVLAVLGVVARLRFLAGVARRRLVTMRDVRRVRAQLGTHRAEIKLALGGVAPEGNDWIALRPPLADLTNARRLEGLFGANSVSSLVAAEEIWRRCTPDQVRAALLNCFRLLKPGGRLRVALAEPSSSASLCGELQSAGFEVTPCQGAYTAGVTIDAIKPVDTLDIPDIPAERVR